MLLGDKIKELREEHGVLQRQLAALLEIDTPMFSKIERGDRYAKRAQVIQLAEYFKIDKNELLTLWLADKVLDAIEGEDELKRKAIEVAQERIGNPHKYRELYGIITIQFPILIFDNQIDILQYSVQAWNCSTFLKILGKPNVQW